MHSIWSLFWFIALQGGEAFPFCLQEEQVVNQLCVISYCCSLLDPDRSTLTQLYKTTDINRQMDWLEDGQKPRKLAQTHTGGLKQSPTGVAEQPEETGETQRLPVWR